MEASDVIATVSIVISVWVGYRQWRRDGPLVRCEWAWDHDETEEGLRNPEPVLVVRAVNLGRAPAQIFALGFKAGRRDLGQISFITKRDGIYGPPLPHTVEGGHLAQWAHEFGFKEDKPVRPYVVVVARWRPTRKARKPIGPPPARSVERRLPAPDIPSDP